MKFVWLYIRSTIDQR